MCRFNAAEARVRTTPPPDRVPGIGEKPFNLSAHQMKLLCENISLVEKTVSLLQSGRSRVLVKRLGDGAVSAGMVALARAAEAFNPARGVKFTTFAWRFIATAVGDAIDSHFGENGRKGATIAPDVIVLEDKSRPPDESVIEQEQEDERASRVEKVRALLGGPVPQTHNELIKAARKLGLSGAGTTQALADRVAERLRQVIGL